MSGRLRDLLRAPTLERRTADYEAVYDDFVHDVGGQRVSVALPVPMGVRNADYLLEVGGRTCIVELKQVSKFDSDQEPERYFVELHRSGCLRTFEHVSSTRVRITRESLTRKQWHRFYDKCRPAIGGALGVANLQLCATENLLPPSNERPVRGVIFLNTGDYHLSTDLMFRLVQRKMTKEWRGGHFRGIDFVTCKSIDLFHPDQHPLHARHLVRNIEDEAVTTMARSLFERWVAYVNSELGTAASIGPSERDTGQDYRVDRAFKGKVRLS